MKRTKCLNIWKFVWWHWLKWFNNKPDEWSIPAWNCSANSCVQNAAPPKITSIWFDNDLSFKYIVANVNEPIADSLLVECISRRSPLLSNGSWFYAGFAWKFLCISTNFSTPTFYKHSWSQRVGICISCVYNYIDWVTKRKLFVTRANIQKRKCFCSVPNFRFTSGFNGNSWTLHHLKQWKFSKQQQ